MNTFKENSTQLIQLARDGLKLAHEFHRISNEPTLRMSEGANAITAMTDGTTGYLAHQAPHRRTNALARTFLQDSKGPCH